MKCATCNTYRSKKKACVRTMRVALTRRGLTPIGIESFIRKTIKTNGLFLTARDRDAFIILFSTDT